MGTRVNYEIGSKPSVILYSNSHHHTEWPEDVFRELLREHAHSQTDLVRALLNARYRAPCGTHRVDDPMFVIDLEPGDREKVLRVTFDYNDQTYAATLTEFDPAPEIGVEGALPAGAGVEAEVVELLTDARKTIHGLAPDRFSIVERIDAKLAEIAQANV